MFILLVWRTMPLGTLCADPIQTPTLPQPKSGRVLLTPFPDPNVDSGVVTLNAVAVIRHPEVGCVEKSSQPGHVTEVVIIKFSPPTIIKSNALPQVHDRERLLDTCHTSGCPERKHRPSVHSLP